MTTAPQSSPASGWLPASTPRGVGRRAFPIALWCVAAAAVSVAPRTAVAQTRRAVAATTVHADPSGAELARLTDTRRLPVYQSRKAWSEVALEGWVWRRSLAATRRDGYDLVVSASGGENLRADPGGAVIARLQEGMLLDRVEVRGQWVRVRRRVWVPARALEEASARARATRLATRGSGPAVAEGYRASPPPAAQRPAARGAPPAPVAPAPPGDWVQPAAKTALYSAPGGSAVGALEPGARARVVTRAGDWVRVETDGWVRASDLQPASGGPLLGITAAEVRANPERFTGQTIQWRLQYLSTAVADELRPEMPQGEPYILARGPLPEAGFVYL